MIYLLDACALIAYFKNEPGGAIVEALLLDRTLTTAIHTVNLCEVYYDFIRFAGKPTADQMIEDALGYKIEPLDYMDKEFWKTAGRYKADLKKLSLADCFALAAAKRLNATLVTSDHAEFDKVVPLDICEILFIR